MTWLVFGVSCLLVLAGTVSIISGAPIVQIERGWTEVIAGSVALSSGGIVFALAAILMRLESVRDMLFVPRAEADVPTSQEAATSPVIMATPVSVVVPTEAPEETAAIADAQQPGSSDTATGQGLWKRVRRTGETAPDAEALERGGFPDRFLSVEAPIANSEIALAALAPIAPSVAIDHAPQAENTTVGEPSQLGWLERSLFKGRLPKAAPDDRTLVPLEPARTASPSFSAEAAEPLHDDALPLSSAHEEDTERAGNEAGVTVIGRYQAGVASYVMYSDGTIEVETEGGQSHRFASMEELKVFIANQDNVLS